MAFIDFQNRRQSNTIARKTFVVQTDGPRRGHRHALQRLRGVQRERGAALAELHRRHAAELAARLHRGSGRTQAVPRKGILLSNV